MIPSEHFCAVSWSTRRQRCVQLTHHRSRVPCRIPDELRRYTPCHMMQCILDGLIRDPQLVCWRLIGSMHTGVDTKDDLAQQFYHR